MITLQLYAADGSSRLDLQYADDGIRAGFPSPAQDYISESIDLNRTLIRHPASTFYAKVAGDSMSGEGIDEGICSSSTARSSLNTATWPCVASTASLRSSASASPAATGSYSCRQTAATAP